MPDLRHDITAALADFLALPLKDASRHLLARLGYKSDKFLAGAGSRPQDFLNDFASGNPLDEGKALVPEWKSADLIFQLTDEELSRHFSSQGSLFTDDSVQRSLLKSYVFIAIELKEANYARGKFSAIARQINRLFPMPVMVLFKHSERLTIAVINRRRNKIDESKDVLEKATLIRDISFANPHRGHLDILASLALANLIHPEKKPINDFDSLHAAWEQIFNIELLNERFYKELSNWYFWALPQVEFPDDLEKDGEKRRATGLIRLLTRLIFCWFLKEKDGLIPEKLFHPAELTKLLNGFDPESETSSTYYLAILQNLFFATLNQRMGKDGNGKPYRFFATDEGFQKNRATYDVNTLYRYENLFAVPQEEAIALFAEIPFLNGGLFECLDRTEDSTDKKLYLDGFSRNPKKRPHVPDRLFFDSGETADLSEVYGDKKRKAEKITGLIPILNRYKFTIVENTPIDQEIALDPELLGKVFENLLASYNEETKTTARKQTGSFYTPRPIVDYMVDESLKAHLTRCLTEKAGMKEDDAKAGLDLLFTYTEKEHPFSESEVAVLITAIDEVKILDPACGSGAFPMGVLHKLVYILGKLDKGNEKWRDTQIAKVEATIRAAAQIDEATIRESTVADLQKQITNIRSAFADNELDYGRKLYLIENCLYGVDIQPIAIQITKLRFFISLVCDQKTNRNKKNNHGIRPLPNLETKFVAANTLMSLPAMDQRALFDPNVIKIESELETLYHQHFSVQRRDQKLAIQQKLRKLRKSLGILLSESLMSPAKSQHLAGWDAFDPQQSSDFFDPHWMFGKSVSKGFDIIISNPPYIGEKGNKNTFSVLKRGGLGDFYMGKVDVFYLFFHFALNSAADGGVISFITTNYFPTADGAFKLRDDLKKRASILKLRNLCDIKVFESALGQHNMISLISKGANNSIEADNCITKRKGFVSQDVLLEILNGHDEETDYFKVSQQDLWDGSKSYLRLPGIRGGSGSGMNSILAKLSDSKLRLGDVCAVNIGMRTGADKVSNSHLESYNLNAEKGEGIYVLTKREIDDMKLNPTEKSMLMPFFKNSDIQKYWCKTKNDLWLINLTYPEFRAPVWERIPNIQNHIRKYRKILEGRKSNDNGLLSVIESGYWWCYTLRQLDFSKPKIVAPQRSLTNCFGYNSLPWVASMDVYFITESDPSLPLKYVLGVLNSKLYYYWLYHRGKRKGEALELYQRPLSEIPLKQAPKEIEREVVRIVDRILDAKESNVSVDATALEREIDQHIYALYGLTPEEIAIVEVAAP